MNPLVDRIVNAVLYEGYILYPYRPSTKNTHRWTFGGLYPRSYSEAQSGSDAWTMQTECLVEGTADTRLVVKVRFLHLMLRQVGQLETPLDALGDGPTPSFTAVASLRVGDRLLQTWQEAVEREVLLPDLRLASLLSRAWQIEFAFPGSSTREAVANPAGEIVALLLRDQQQVAGAVAVSAQQAADGLFKILVRIENRTPLADAEIGRAHV